MHTQPRFEICWAKKIMAIIFLSLLSRTAELSLLCTQNVTFYAQCRKWKSVTQSYPTLCDPMDCSLPGSSVHEILQARILEWVAISFCRGSSQPRDWSWVSCTTGRFFTNWATREAQHRLEFNSLSFSSHNAGMVTERHDSPSMLRRPHIARALPKGRAGCLRQGRCHTPTSKSNATFCRRNGRALVRTVKRVD